MKTLRWTIQVVTALALAGGVFAQTPLGTAFTYQGRLTENGAPADGTYDLQFTLFNADTLGSPVGLPACADNVIVADGLFTVTLDFGAGAFGGDARWLQIDVRADSTPGNCGGGAYATLTPRQPLTATPYALYALNAPGGAFWAANGNDIHNTNTGNVGVGVNSPAHALDVSGDVRADGRAAFGNDGVIGLQGYYDRIFDFSHTITDFSSTDSWAGWNSEFRLEPTLDLTGANAKYFYSHFFWVEVPPGNPHDVQYVQGPYIYAGNNGNGSVEILAGAFISAQSDGDAVEHLGCEIGAWGLGPNANITNNYALSLRTGQLHAGGTIENNYALYISAPESVVDVQNNIGFYMADQNVAGADESWAIYSDGGRSYFADGISIGTTDDSPYKLFAINETDTAIYGKVEANSGAFGYGVYGQSDSNSGGGGVFGIAPIIGVRGLATGTTGTAFGGYFQADSPGGWAGFFVGRGYFSGNVGIGTQTPASPLHVAAPQAVTRIVSSNHPSGSVLVLQNDTVAPTYLGAINFQTNAGGTPGQIGYLATQEMTFRVNGSERMRIDPDGDVGIGIAVPDVPLHVNGGTDTAANGGGYFVCGTVAGANLSIDNNEIMARNNGVAATLFLNADGGNVSILQGGTGNVGIGTSSPTLAKVQIDATNQRCIYGTNNSATFASGYFENLGAGPAGVFEGDVSVVGSVSKSGGSFRIDHPLDPANKYLYHSFVESPDMMNVYNGNVVTDARGYATVEMPEWFETLNRDFRYQLTVIGQFAQAIIAEEMRENRFVIQTNKPNVKVSWQVTGIRQDPWANEHRIPVEQDKPDHERGKYQHPELYGQPAEMGINHHAPSAAVEDAEQERE